jgi:DNA-binding MarR family transcriptional regulator
MIALHRMGSMPQQELGSRFAIDRSSLSRNIKLLVEAKLVRSTKMDGKSILLSLTAKGSAKISGVLPDWLALQQKVTEVLGIHAIREIDRVNDVLKEMQV